MRETIGRRPRVGAGGGFTLIEMLLVLGLIVAVVGISWPALRGSLASRRLREAGKMMRVELAKTRLDAIDRGRSRELRYLPGTGRYRVGSETSAMDGPLADAAAESLMVEGELTGEGREREEGLPLFTEHELPQGIVFATDDSPYDLPPEDAGPAPAAEAEWSGPLCFQPDGTTCDAAIRLRSERGAELVVSLRGLTGVSRVGDVVSPR